MDTKEQKIVSMLELEKCSENLLKFKRAVVKRYKRLVEVGATIEELHDLRESNICGIVEDFKGRVNKFIRKGRFKKDCLIATQPKQDPVDIQSDDSMQALEMGGKRWLNLLLWLHRDRKEFKYSELRGWFEGIYNAGYLKVPQSKESMTDGKKISYVLCNAIAASVNDAKTLANRKSNISERLFFICNKKRLKELIFKGKKQSKKQGAVDNVTYLPHLMTDQSIVSFMKWVAEFPMFTVGGARALYFILWFYGEQKVFKQVILLDHFVCLRHAGRLSGGVKDNVNTLSSALEVLVRRKVLREISQQKSTKREFSVADKSKLDSRIKRLYDLIEPIK